MKSYTTTSLQHAAPVCAPQRWCAVFDYVKGYGLHMNAYKDRHQPVVLSTLMVMEKGDMRRELSPRARRG